MGYYSGIHYIGKRSAEPESAPLAAPESKADPAYLYRYGYPYYRGYYGYHPYGVRYLGKRSADAEPLAGPEPKAEGKADPESLYYGYYGYPYGYYGGYYGYPYGYRYGYYYGK